MRFLGLGLALVMAGCGDDGHMGPSDGAAFGDGWSDAGVSVDAGPMTVPDFGRCGSTVECVNPESACLPVAPLDGTSLCLPACGVTLDCPVDTFCYQRDDGPYALIKGRCFYSYCGEAFDNGETGGECHLGAEQTIPTEEQLLGWCYPFHDGAWGICLETGTVEAGGVCDMTDRCRGADCENCAPGSVCVDGFCHEICDPRLPLATAQCATGEACWDRSEVHVFSNGPPGTGTWGTCEEGSACLLFGAACPNGTAGTDQGCLPTTPVRPAGFCSAGAAGDLEAGVSCPPDGVGDPYECVEGALCITEGAASTCQLLCDLEEVVRPCPNDTTCEALLWTTDPQVKTDDWGTCR